LRAGLPLTVDLVPDLDAGALTARLPAKAAFFFEMSGGAGLPRSEWTRTVKALPVRHAGLRPMDEAISTAGGVRFDALTPELMLRDRPGVFAAGEMLDWEAPTGGYLLTACMATGRWAGRAAAKHLAQTA
jgi:succinate dehydrogenase/fumarate reductase flavoprotein subunit